MKLIASPSIYREIDFGVKRAFLEMQTVILKSDIAGMTQKLEGAEIFKCLVVIDESGDSTMTTFRPEDFEKVEIKCFRYYPENA